MIACFDVGYETDEAGGSAIAACVTFADWDASEPNSEHALTVDGVAAYQSGNFYRRELPCLQELIDTTKLQAELLIVDGYVWLDDRNSHPGLGAHLYHALGESTPVVGVAKKHFATADGAVEIYRGGSRRPLYVSAAGMQAADAALGVQKMHGSHRIPWMLGRVDQLSRGAEIHTASDR